MLDFLIIDLLLLIFLILTIFENQNKPNIKKAPLTTRKLSPKFLLIFVLILFLIVLFFVLFGPGVFVYWYIRISFIFLMIGHIGWLMVGKAKVQQALILSSGLVITLLRFLYPSNITHNLFIITSFLWIGPFLTQFKLLNLKRFIIISLIWFIYDILFVWVTPLALQVAVRTTTLGFPLAITIGESFLGSGDLLWANLFLSTLKNSKQQLLAVIILLVSNLGLGIYDNLSQNKSIYPLLVLWVPLGLILLKTTTIDERIKK